MTPDVHHITTRLDPPNPIILERTEAPTKTQKIKALAKHSYVQTNKQTTGQPISH